MTLHQMLRRRSCSSKDVVLVTVFKVLDRDMGLSRTPTSAQSSQHMTSAPTNLALNKIPK